MGTANPQPAGRVSALLARQPSWSIVARFTLTITVSTAWRKMWHARRREGSEIGRERTARLMRLADLSGKGTGGARVTTRQLKGPDLRPASLLIVNSKHQGQSSCKGPILHMCALGKDSCTQFLSPMFDSCRILGWALSETRCAPRRFRCKHLIKPMCVRRIPQVLFTIWNTGRSR